MLEYTLKTKEGRIEKSIWSTRMFMFGDIPLCLGFYLQQMILMKKVAP